MVCANVTTGGDLKKGVSEQECAEYCWSLPDCKAWSFYRFGSGYCYPYASSDCIERNKGWFWDRVSWGSASCGASKGKSIFIYSLKRQHLKSKYKSETHTQTISLHLGLGSSRSQKTKLYYNFEKGCEINESTYLCAGNNEKIERMTSASPVMVSSQLLIG